MPDACTRLAHQRLDRRALGRENKVQVLGPRQQRDVAPDKIVTSRIADVNLFYNTLDVAEARNILAKYGVEYVVVGSLENTYYWPEGQLKFDQMVAEGTLQEVFRDEFARIYQVVGIRD